MPKIKTLRVKSQNGESSILYHAGGLQSHVLYAKEKAVIDPKPTSKFFFTRQLYSEIELLREKKRIEKFHDYTKEASIIEIIVDKDCMFVGELVNEEAGEHMTAEILESELEGKYPHNPINFIYKSSQVEKYITVFNETNDCWMEEFKTLEAAILYLIQETDAEGNKQE